MIKVTMSQEEIEEQFHFQLKWLLEHGATLQGYLNHYSAFPDIDGRELFIFDLSELVWLSHAAAGHKTDWQEIYQMTAETVKQGKVA